MFDILNSKYILNIVLECTWQIIFVSFMDKCNDIFHNFFSIHNFFKAFF